LTNAAEAYRRDLLPKAQGSAAEIINQAEAYKQTRIRLAEGEVQRFLAVLAEYNKASDITRKRLLLETLEDILSQPGLEKLILPSGVTEHMLPFLPLDSGSRSLSSPSSSLGAAAANSPALAPAGRPQGGN
jgi:membrane protease subunit HflK